LTSADVWPTLVVGMENRVNTKETVNPTETTFVPRLSRWITGMYWSILAFLVFMLVAIPLQVLFLVVFLPVIVVFIFIMLKAYRMRFTIGENRIIVNGIFKKNRIEIAAIKSIDKIPMPAGVRLFGASFLGGWYYLPGIGKAWVTMGNFQDGVLISTEKNKHYVITPQDPLKFIKVVKRKMA